MEIKIDPDSVPATVKEAVDIIVAGMDEEMREALLEPEKTTMVEINGRRVEVPNNADLHFGIGRCVRNTWSFWEDTPLRRDAIETHGIAHGDDIWGLVIDWVKAIVREDKEWKPEDTVQRFIEHWANYNQTPLTAAGIKDPNAEK